MKDVKYVVAASGPEIGRTPENRESLVGGPAASPRLPRRVYACPWARRAHRDAHTESGF